MAYVRIDDGAMSHPKILELSDKAFRLWVWGLCYAQMHLTDGYIPRKALPARWKAATGALMKPNPILWEPAEGGFQVHDYCVWNDSKVRVEKNRKDARERIAKKRGDDRRQLDDRRDCSVENISDVPSVTTTANLPVRTSVISSGFSSLCLEEGSGEKPPTARSGRPIFVGTKFVVFEWQLTNCVNDLGGLEAADAFRLDEWFHDLNAQCERERIIVPKRDGGAWLQQQLIAEAQRRGIPLRIAVAAEAGKLTNRLGSALANIHAEAK